MKQKLVFIGVLLILTGLVLSLAQFDSPKDFQYELKTCSSAKGFANNSITFEALNNSIEFHQVLNTYCNANNNNFKLTHSRKGNEIQINEIFSADTVTRCVCPLEISGEILNLEKGDYEITFIFDNKYTKQKDVLESKEFKLG